MSDDKKEGFDKGSGDKRPDKKGHDIIVNGELINFENEEISYEEVIKLAFPDDKPNDDEIRYAVTYFDAKGRDKTEGNLGAGQKVKLQEGTKFYVERTNKS